MLGWYGLVEAKTKRSSDPSLEGLETNHLVLIFCEHAT